MAKRQTESVARMDSTYMKHYDAYMDRHQRKKKRLVRRLVMFALLVSIVAGSMVFYSMKQQSLYADKQEKYDQLQQEMTALKKEEKGLEQEIELLKDEEYVLQIARTNYFFSKEGEIIFKMPNEDPSY
ncbi:septum formation initiator family protein [Halobacillus litoralis]|uniref:Septum formation initiator family protein n=1 Tax=Halobacillus litoralis TaxID=45668 RepID=A0A845FHJ7_9BACI|nr:MULTISPECIES: septum formation initiator family protein [Halobacillus]MBN9656236.1 septum formation initiator family protein [Halobacillus sp. GSS1]MEC3882209.1 septum formation initiator family protein [Halobacillus sp. HZG1]MYL72977.1 septum formation initiator family protein [Halobacillus litoralis]